MQVQQPQVDITQTSGVTCDDCGGVYFDQSLILRKVSGLISGTGKPSYIPIPIFACKKCGTVNEEFLPREIKNLDKE